MTNRALCALLISIAAMSGGRSLGAACDSAGVGSTQLEIAANGLAAGEWCEMTPALLNFTQQATTIQDILDACGNPDNYAQYANSMAYDPTQGVAGRLWFWGTGHGSSNGATAQGFIYDLANNEFTVAPEIDVNGLCTEGTACQTDWETSTTQLCDNCTEEHAYDGVADDNNGSWYHGESAFTGQGGSQIIKVTGDTVTINWKTVGDTSNLGMRTSNLEFWPDYGTTGSLVCLADTTGSNAQVNLYDMTADTWSDPFADITWDTGSGNTSNRVEYNHGSGQIWITEGDGTGDNHLKLWNNGGTPTLDTLGATPAAIDAGLGLARAKATDDPVDSSGKFIVWYMPDDTVGTTEAGWWEYDMGTDTWTTFTTLGITSMPPLFKNVADFGSEGILAGTVPELGITVWISHRDDEGTDQGGMFLYKHSAFTTAGPNRSNSGPTGTIDFEVNESGTQGTTVHLSINTDVDADCRFSTTPDTAYASMTDFSNDFGYCEDDDAGDGNPFSAANDDSTWCDDNTDCASNDCRRYVHVHTLTGLAQTAHNYYVRCHDGTNPNVTDTNITFTIDDTVSDFDDRCADPGVVLCLGFDSELALLDPNNVPYVEPDDDEGDAASNDQRCINEDCEQIAMDVAASGAGSLRFEYPASPTVPSSSAYFEHNFEPDSERCYSSPCPEVYAPTIGIGETVYIQYRYRFTSSMYRRFDRTDSGDSGAKLMIIGTGDTSSTYYASCTENEIVLDIGEYGGPFGYHQCGGSANHNFQGTFGECTGSTYHDANPCCCATGLPTGCTAQGGIYTEDVPHADACTAQDPPTGGTACDDCIDFVTDDWNTVTHRISIGDSWATGTGSHTAIANAIWQMWLTPAGGVKTKMFDSTDTNYHSGDWHWHTESGAELGKLWILPQVTFKDGTETHDQGFFYYDEVIVSTSPIAEPGAGSSGSFTGTSASGATLR